MQKAFGAKAHESSTVSDNIDPGKPAAEVSQT